MIKCGKSCGNHAYLQPVIRVVDAYVTTVYRVAESVDAQVLAALRPGICQLLTVVDPHSRWSPVLFGLCMHNVLHFHTK